jgi:hypothetical protein
LESLPDGPSADDVRFDVEAETRALLDQHPELDMAKCSIESPSDRGYNCMAWAAGDNKRNWSPAPGPGGKQLGGFYWPEGVALRPSVTAAEEVFRKLGYKPCRDDDNDANVEKVVIYGDDLGEVKHAARQAPSGRWASKMGDLADIEHDDPEVVECALYGTARRYMCRWRKAPVVEERRTLLLPPGS